MNVGDTWKSWKVDAMLGEGTFGKVYKISRSEFGHTYESALKVIRIPPNAADYDIVLNDSMSEERAKEYFYGMVKDIVSEFALMSELRGDSNIVSYEDHEVVEIKDGFGWEIFIRMELLTPLFNYLRKNTFTVGDVVSLGIDICKAIEVCEDNNIIHRDIKPENIFISKRGQYKLGDFGIARQMEKTSSEMSKKGTPSYMAPEVFKCQPYDSTVDIYSLGIVMYRFLNSNRNPFMPPYPEKVHYSDKDQANGMRLTGQPMPAPCNAYDDLTNIVLKACAYDPASRYRTALDMHRDLLSLVNRPENDMILFPIKDLGKEYSTMGSAAGKFTNLNLQGEASMSMSEAGEFSIHSSASEMSRSMPFGRTSGTNADASVVITPDKIIDQGFDDATMTTPMNPFIAREQSFSEPSIMVPSEPSVASVSADCDSSDDAETVMMPLADDAENTEDSNEISAVAALAAAAGAPSVSDKASEQMSSGSTSSQGTLSDKSQSSGSSSRRSGSGIKIGIAAALVVVIAVAAFIMLSKPKVPYVVGFDADMAQTLIEDEGFVYVEKTEFSDEVNAGIVISQSNVGEKLKKGTNIEVVISRGSAIELPDISGKNLNEALADLEKIGMTMTVADTQRSDTLKEGVIISQDPAAGSQCGEGDEIKVIVSAGLIQVKVPDVVGKTEADATKAIKDAGLTVTVNYESSASVESGKIISQSVKAGKEVDKNSNVTITASTGQQQQSSGSSGSNSKSKSKSKKKKKSGGEASWS